MKVKWLCLSLLLLPAIGQARNLFCHPGDCYLWVFGNQARVEIHNPTEDTLSCNGNVTVYTQRGRRQFRSIFETVYPGQRVYEYIYSYDYRDRLTYGTGFVTCRPLNQ
jgi:hypothetical protein